MVSDNFANKIEPTGKAIGGMIAKYDASVSVTIKCSLPSIIFPI